MTTTELNTLLDKLVHTGEYSEAAETFLKETNSKLDIKFLRNGKHFSGDNEVVRDIYHVTLSRGNRSFSFEFGQSLMNSQYYQDVKFENRSYCLDGSPRTGSIGIRDLNAYQAGGMHLKLIKGKAPDAYDILACLTTYDPGTFKDFCFEFGYDEDSRRDEKTYNAVKEEWQNVCMLYTDEEIEALQCIN